MGDEARAALQHSLLVVLATHLLHDTLGKKLPQCIIQQVQVSDISSSIVQQLGLKGTFLPHLIEPKRLNQAKGHSNH